MVQLSRARHATLFRQHGTLPVIEGRHSRVPLAILIAGVPRAPLTLPPPLFPFAGLATIPAVGFARGDSLCAGGVYGWFS
jgi:hypothetical protein